MDAKKLCPCCKKNEATNMLYCIGCHRKIYVESQTVEYVERPASEPKA